MRARETLLALALLAACGTEGKRRREPREDEDPPAPPAPASPPRALGAAQLCEALYGAAAKTLDASCAGTAAYLRELEKTCVRELEPAVSAGGVQVDEAAAKACSAKIAAVFAAGRPLQAPADLGALGCAGVVRGALAAGAACVGSVQCAAPLVCDASSRCADPPAAGAACRVFDAGLQLSAKGACAAASYCPGAPFPDPPIDPLAIIGAPGVGLLGTDGGRLGGRRSKVPKVRMGATNVSGRLPPEVIQRIVRQNFGRFRLCYENGLRADPTLRGRVSVRFVIKADGSVGTVTTPGTDLKDPGVVACVSKAFTGLSFPQPEGGIVTVTYPILFEPPEGADASSPAGSASAAAAPPPPPPPSVWVGPAPAKGVCAARAAKGGACLASSGCAQGLACVDRVCGEGPGPRTCQGHADCAVGEACLADAGPRREPPSGVCRPRKGAGEACKVDDECQGKCKAAVCQAPCAVE